jgi:DNA-binding transcriptional LysR family regulator
VDLQALTAYLQVMDWNDLQYFQAVAHAGNLADAGSRMGVDATTVSRKVRRLEAALGQTLFEYRRDGQALTAAGKQLLTHVQTMAGAALALASPSGDKAQPSGLLRISVAEGFGTWFIAPRLAVFSRSYPEIVIDLYANNGFLSPSRKEADVAILLAQPRKGPLKTRKLADYRLGIYAAIDAWTDIIDVSQLGTVPLVSYIPDFIYAPELLYLDEIGPRLTPAIRSSSITAQAQLIATGAGIGVLPCFMGNHDTRLVRILPQIEIERTFWLTVHQDVANQRHVRLFIDWIVAIARADPPQ